MITTGMGLGYRYYYIVTWSPHQLLQKSEAAVIIINEECLMTEKECSVNKQEFQFLAEICAKKIPSDSSQIWGLSIPNINTVI